MEFNYFYLFKIASNVARVLALSVLNSVATFLFLFIRSFLPVLNSPFTLCQPISCFVV